MHFRQLENTYQHSSGISEIQNGFSLAAYWRLQGADGGTLL